MLIYEAMSTESLYLNAAKCKKTERPPIWMMRQAGRYLPEYRELRKKYSFMEMMHTPELAAEVTIQPITRFGMDAAIMFSDILITAQALGSDLDFVEGKGPVLSNPITSEESFNTLLKKKDVSIFSSVETEIKILKKELGNTALIGFAGAPFTVASYMIEGGSSKDLKKTKQCMLNNPTLFNSIISELESITIDYLNKQIAAGVDALQLFDSWTNTLSWNDFNEISSKPLQRIIQSLDNPKNIPITIFCKNSGLFYPMLENTGCNAISLD
jgi:uroporphyrinogen decarboxylase